MLARGLQTKQIARSLGISVKTADRHIQNAYAKIGVSTRAAATLFAMEHGLVVWGELPISRLNRALVACSLLGTPFSEEAMLERYETIVVGGGQAGLSVGYHLAKRGHCRS